MPRSTLPGERLAIISRAAGGGNFSFLSTSVRHLRPRAAPKRTGPEAPRRKAHGEKAQNHRCWAESHGGCREAKVGGSQGGEVCTGCQEMCGRGA